jgi:hypothetical protein
VKHVDDVAAAFDERLEEVLRRRHRTRDRRAGDQRRGLLAPHGGGLRAGHRAIALRRPRRIAAHRAVQVGLVADLPVRDVEPVFAGEAHGRRGILRPVGRGAAVAALVHARLHHQVGPARHERQHRREGAERCCVEVGVVPGVSGGKTQCPGGHGGKRLALLGDRHPVPIVEAAQHRARHGRPGPFGRHGDRGGAQRGGQHDEHCKQRGPDQAGVHDKGRWLCQSGTIPTPRPVRNATLAKVPIRQ